jgi:hypothetical protein
MSFGMHARNIIAGQGRYNADKAPETKEPTMSFPHYDDALHMMTQIGGSFAKAIANAYYVADSGNRRTLVAAFKPLFDKYETAYQQHLNYVKENTK